MTEKHDSSKGKKINRGRRQVTRNILLGGGVIGAGATRDLWSKPVIKSTVLPAHAIPSDVVMCTTCCGG